MKTRFSLVSKEVPLVSTANRRIATPIPAPGTEEFLQEITCYEPDEVHTAQLPIVWDRAEGHSVYDRSGNKWIDFTSTIFVTNTGHNDAHVIEAVRSALDRKLLHAYTFGHEPRLRLLKKLIEITPSFCEKAMLRCSGTEATEAALEVVRTWGHKKDPQKVGIVSFTRAMHGRSLGTVMLRGMPEKSGWVGYHDPHMYRLDFPFPWLEDGDEQYDWQAHFARDIEKLRSAGALPEKLCAFFIESYQGWGALFYPPAYIQALAAFAKEHEILMVFDEIQSGLGRTGKLFCFEHYHVEPDLICLGKALGGGLPLSAVVGRKELLDVGMHATSTHYGPPLVCAAAVAVLEQFRDGSLVSETARKGEILHARLQEIQSKYPARIKRVLGKGLVAALLLEDGNDKDDKELVTKICERAMEKGLLLVPTTSSIKIGPPLIITDSALLEGLSVLEECFQELLPK